MKVQESAENYLEAILALRQQNGNVRSIDVAARLGVTKPSVSRAMGLLRENGYICMDSDGLLTLTQTGEAIAAQIYERHQVLTRWLTDIGVPPVVAAEDACRMEHAIGQQTFEYIKAFIQENTGARGAES